MILDKVPNDNELTVQGEDCERKKTYAKQTPVIRGHLLFGLVCLHTSAKDSFLYETLARDTMLHLPGER